MKKIFFSYQFIFIFLFLYRLKSLHNKKIRRYSLCFKKFNANYRLSKWKCSDDEREIPKGTVDYEEGIKFLKISDLVLVLIVKHQSFLKTLSQMLN